MRHALLAILLLALPTGLLAQAQVEPPIAHDDPAGKEGPTPEDSKLETAAARRVSTVKEVLASHQDDEDVMLRGRIVRHVKGDDYVFADSTGEIEVEIEEDDYPRDRTVMDGEIEIRGETDLDLNETATVEVDEIARAPTSKL
jgi:uncharacterized protein (TIGR00156 family)